MTDNPVECALDRLEKILEELRVYTKDNTGHEDCDELRVRVAEALDYMDREADKHSPMSLVGQILTAIGCRLTGRRGNWKPGDR